MSGDQESLSKYLVTTKEKVSRHNYEIILGGALNAAIVGGDHEIVRMLIADGANIDGASRKRDPPLLRAEVCGDYKTMKALIDDGANIYVKMENHHDALWIAIESNDVAALNMLLDAGFDPCINGTIPSDDGSRRVNRQAMASKLRFPEEVVKRLQCVSD